MNTTVNKNVLNIGGNETYVDLAQQMIQDLSDSRNTKTGDRASGYFIVLLDDAKDELFVGLTKNTVGLPTHQWHYTIEVNNTFSSIDTTDIGPSLVITKTLDVRELASKLQEIAANYLEAIGSGVTELYERVVPTKDEPETALVTFKTVILKLFLAQYDQTQDFWGDLIEALENDFEFDEEAAKRLLNQVCKENTDLGRMELAEEAYRSAMLVKMVTEDGQYDKWATLTDEVFRTQIVPSVSQVCSFLAQMPQTLDSLGEESKNALVCIGWDD